MLLLPGFIPGPLIPQTSNCAPFMKKIDKLILSSFFGPFILTTLVVVFILLLQTMLRYFDEFFGKGIDLTVFLEMFFYFALNITPSALPLAVLLSSLITFGNLGEHYELTAIKSSGISLTRTLLPIFIFVVGLTIGAFFFNNNVVPKTNLSAYSLLWDIRQKKPTLDFKEGEFYNGLEGYSVKVDKKFKDDKTLKGLMIYDHTSRIGNDKVILADSGIMNTIMNDSYLTIKMFNGNLFQESENPGKTKVQFIRSSFKEMTAIFDLNAFKMGNSPLELFKENKQMKNIKELERSVDSIRGINKTLSTELQAYIKQYYSFHTHNLDTLKLKVPLDSVKSLKKFDKSKKEMILSAAISEARTVKSTYTSYKDRFQRNTRDANGYEIEKYRKYTASVACLIMFLIGAPLGAIIKKGGLGIPVLISIAFFITFYVITITSEKWAKESIVSVEYASWAANLVLFPIGLFFLRQARNDARVFDADAYAVFWNKLKKRFKK
jgi:lipopolysaccharide export system permease protein